MKRKVVALVIAMALVGSVFAGGNKDSGAQSGQKKLVFKYLTNSMGNDWQQTVFAALKELGDQYNFEITAEDPGRNIQTQLNQIDAAILQRIDGAFLFIVDEGSAPAAIAKLNDAKIPVIGETLKLQDGNGRVIAPYVELNAEAVGNNIGKWMVDNWRSTGVNLSNLNTVGVIRATNSRNQSDMNRAVGFTNAIKAGFPTLREANYFMADIGAESGTNLAEFSYNQVSAVIGAHPEMTAWLIIGTVDIYAIGAARAIQAAGLESRTIIASPGGEMTRPEWDKGPNVSPCLRAVCYYTAMDFAKYMVEGMLAMCRKGKKAEEILPQFIEPGQKYAVVKVSGTMVTRDNYKQYERK
jgi:L-arabinose transport system substrate-binding protein